jgi:hypothetical protein
MIIRHVDEVTGNVVLTCQYQQVVKIAGVPLPIQAVR